MTTKEIAKVTKGWIDGKTIQVLDKGVWYDLTEEPNWHFDHRDYRVKPSEPKLRPYASAKEFVEAQQEHGLYFGKDNKIYHIQNSVYDNYGKTYVTGAGFDMTTESLFKEGYIWFDGTPCGIIEEEQQC